MVRRLPGWTDDGLMRFAILGPLEVSRNGAAVPIGGPQQRAVLAVLLLDPGRVVSVDRLIEHLWGDEPPPAARSLVQGCVAGLRRAGGPPVPHRAETAVRVHP
jgi:DNA-binding SARP family transcriptional activator